MFKANKHKYYRYCDMQFLLSLGMLLLKISNSNNFCSNHMIVEILYLVIHTYLKFSLQKKKIQTLCIVLHYAPLSRFVNLKLPLVLWVIYIDIWHIFQIHIPPLKSPSFPDVTLMSYHCSISATNSWTVKKNMWLLHWLYYTIFFKKRRGCVLLRSAF